MKMRAASICANFSAPEPGVAGDGGGLGRDHRFHVDAAAEEHRRALIDQQKGGAVAFFGFHQRAIVVAAFGVAFLGMFWLSLALGLQRARQIAIDRGAGRSARDQVIERGTDRLRDGINVVIFPEGTRLPPRTEKRFGQGGALLATASGAPVVPIAHNAGSYWPRRSITKKPGTIRMMIGPAVDPAGMTAQQLNELIHDWMRETMAGLEGTNPRTTDNKPILEAPRQ